MPRRAPLWATLALLTLGLLVVPPRARANTTVQGMANVSAGWTDNVLNAVDHPMPPMRGRESDFFFQLMPGAALTTAAPRFIQRLQYTFTADLFVTHSEADSYSNTLDWAGFLASSRTTNFLVTLRSQQGRLNTFNLNQASAEATPEMLTAASSVGFFAQTMAQSLDWTPGHWRLIESTSFRAFIPLDRGQLPDTYDTVGELAGERLFRRDALGLILRADYVAYLATMPGTDNQHQIIASLVGRWRRDWSPSWSTEAALGVVKAKAFAGGGSDPDWQPNARAALRWSRDVARAELHYTYGVTPNPLAGSSFAIHEAALQWEVQMPQRTHLILGTTLAYQHAQQIIFAPGMPATSADLVLFDFSIGWQPRPEIGVFARYSLYDQFGEAVPVMATSLPSLTRNTVLLGVNVVYPAVPAVRVPTRLGARVDNTDQPGLPELHSQPR